jgi:hypothetical protein
MKAKRAKFQSQLPTKQIADLFQQEAHRQLGVGGKVGGFFRNQRLTFSKPTSNGAFAEFEDHPDFEVLANIPKLGKIGGEDTVVHMYVWDEGGNRLVEFVCPHTIGGIVAASRSIEGFSAALRGADQSASLVEST